MDQPKVVSKEPVRYTSALPTASELFRQDKNENFNVMNGLWQVVRDTDDRLSSLRNEI